MLPEMNLLYFLLSGRVEDHSEDEASENEAGDQGDCLFLKKESCTESRLPEYYIEFLRSKSIWSSSVIFLSSRRVEQKDGLYEPDFYLE